MINWDKLNTKDMRLISQIVKRGSKIGQAGNRMDLEMDVTAAHLNSPLRLTELLQAKDSDFMHDFCGIVRHIDRSNGKLQDCFVPRYAA